MARYIDVESLEDKLKEHISKTESELMLGALSTFLRLLDITPTADVVPMERYKSMENTCVKLQKSLADVAPVVRCKDCRHAVDYYHEGDCYCSNPKWGLNYFGGSWEFYCADAERRNNE